MRTIGLLVLAASLLLSPVFAWAQDKPVPMTAGEKKAAIAGARSAVNRLRDAMRREDIAGYADSLTNETAAKIGALSLLLLPFLLDDEKAKQKPGYAAARRDFDALTAKYGLQAEREEDPTPEQSRNLQQGRLLLGDTMRFVSGLQKSGLAAKKDAGTWGKIPPAPPLSAYRALSPTRVVFTLGKDKNKETLEARREEGKWRIHQNFDEGKAANNAGQTK